MSLAALEEGLFILLDFFLKMRPELSVRSFMASRPSFLVYHREQLSDERYLPPLLADDR